MKKLIREMINDLQRKKAKEPAPLGDLSNQTLSKDPAERTRQLDYQAQRDEERQRSS